jgi:hypothetical protein
MCVDRNINPHNTQEHIMNKRIRTGLLAAAMVGGGLVGASQLAGNVSAESSGETPVAELTSEPAAESTSENAQGLVAQVDDTEAPAPAGDEEGAREGCGGRGGNGLESAAGAIGIEADELREGVQSGLTIAEVAQVNGVSAQSVIDVMVEERAQHLEEEVAAGELTEAEAAEKLEGSVERITTNVNEGRPDRPERPAEAGADEA